MNGEKRKDHRQALKYPARIDLDDGNPPVPCLLMDVSQSGARVIIEGHDLPETFTLLLAGASGTQRRCKVIWRDGNNFGARFLKTTAAKPDNTAGFRDMMRRG